jgi:hypothetical protein
LVFFWGQLFFLEKRNQSKCGYAYLVSFAFSLQHCLFCVHASMACPCFLVCVLCFLVCVLCFLGVVCTLVCPFVCALGCSLVFAFLPQLVCCLVFCLLPSLLSAALSFWPHHPLMFSQISLWVGVSVFAHTHPHRYLRNYDRVVGPKSYLLACLVCCLSLSCVFLRLSFLSALLSARLSGHLFALTFCLPSSSQQRHLVHITVATVLTQKDKRRYSLS